MSRNSHASTGRRSSATCDKAIGPASVSYDNNLADALASLTCEGPQALSDEALLAILIGNPTAGEIAAQILSHFPEPARLRRVSLDDLARIPGLDPGRAAALQAAIELGRRVLRRPWPRGERLRSSRAVYRALAPRLRDLRRELFFVLLLDGRNRKIGEVQVSEGSLSASIVHPREVFLPAIRASAAAILVVHNHPSGDCRPSPEDREVTYRLRRAGHLLGIRVLDHVIIGESAYYSFAEEGAMAEPLREEPSAGGSGYGQNRPNRG